MSSSSCASVLLCAIVISTHALTSGEIEQSWLDQYNSISLEIAAQNSLAKAAAVTAARTMLDSNALVLSSDRTPLDVLARRTRLLIDDLARKGIPKQRIAQFRSRLTVILTPAGLAKTSATQQFASLSALHREAALTNPLLNFDSLLFVTMIPTGGHMCDQYFPWTVDQSANGGIYILA